MRRLLGLKDLLHDAIEKTTDLVQETHESVADKPIQVLSLIEPLGETARAVDGVHRLTARAVYTTIRATNQGIRMLEDAGVALARSAAADAGVDLLPNGEGPLATPLASNALGTLSWWVDHAQGALNGAIGDFLSERGNGLEIRMGLRHRGVTLEPEQAALSGAFPEATPKICVFVHGLGCTEWAWSFLAEEFHGDPEANFGTLLARELGYTPLYVRYNTGLHVSENGERLAELIDEVLRAYPVPVSEVVLVGHSMGGLVSRSAAHYGAQAGATWTRRLTHLFCIGSPHMGAPLEKASNLLASVLSFFDTPGTQIPAKILNARSAGIKDLRFGYTVEEEWAGKDPDAYLKDDRLDLPFVDSVLYCFVASTLTEDPNHPVGQLIGDVLVRLPSAAGFAPEESRRVPFHSGRVIGGAHHLELMNHPRVYEEIRRWLSEGGPTRAVPELRG